MSLASVRLRYVLRRVVQAIPIIFIIASLDFLLVHLAPGNVVDALAGSSGSATPEYIALLRHEFGLDQPLYVQYADYLKNIFTLNLGYSYFDNMAVATLITQRLPATLLLMGAAIVLSVGGGVLLGLFAAERPNSVRDRVISVLALVSYATPLFWVGLMLIVLFSLHLRWLPPSGMQDVAQFYTGWMLVVDILRHLLLPAITLSLFYLALYARLMRSSFLEHSGMDYVVTARAKGLTPRAVTFRHILQNACLPVVTMAGVQIGNLLGGSVVVESVFAWPGIGQLAFRALVARDLNLLLAIFFIAACLVIVVNLIVDVIYTVLDPRIELA
ncbi:MAG: ABC transporter permease [Vulcanimicrobiaceae bacterium]